MRKFILEFIRRGCIASGIGPVVLGLLYLILRQTGDISVLTVNEVCVGIFSMTALAFVSGGINAIYQLERLPLMVAILIHGSVLYISYLGTYLLNAWLDLGLLPIAVFSAIFVVGYIVIWAVIYRIIKRNTDRVNAQLQKHQRM
jgi:hypothetical protein